ncbi:MAG: methyltransferase domain-containing protein [Pseudomonadota bacterium]
MEANLQRRIQRYGWDRAAGCYEDGWKANLAPAQNRLLLMAEAWPNEHAVDLACGTGLVTLPLAHAVGRSGRVIATDISERMVDAVLAEAEDLDLPQIEAFRADAESLDVIPDASVDLVTCALGLMYVADPLRAMQEVYRILKPGGRAVFAVWGERRNCGWAEIFPIVDARVHSAVCPLFFRLGTGETLAQEMEEAGLYGIETARISSELDYPDDKSALVAAFAGGPVALAYHRFDAETRIAVHREYLHSIAPFRRAKGYRIAGEFVVCRGFKPV